jgi:hypothetical protein
MNRLSCVFFTLLITVFPLCALDAFSSSFNVFRSQPHYLANPYWSLASPASPTARVFRLASYFDYSYKPFKATSAARIKTDVIAQLASLHLGGAYGITDSLSLSLGLPVVFINQFTQIGGSDQSNKIGAGDIQVMGNWTYFRSKNNGFKLAMHPFGFIPTGYGDLYIGHDDASGGLLLSAEGRISKAISLAINAGYQFKPALDSGDVHSDDDLILGLGMTYGSKKNWHYFFESQIRSPIDKLYQTRRNILIEARVGWRYSFNDQWTIRATAGSSLFDDIGAAPIRIAMGVEWRLVFKKKPVVRQEPPEKPIFEILYAPEPNKAPPPVKIPKKKKAKKRPRRFLPIY